MSEEVKTIERSIESWRDGLREMDKLSGEDSAAQRVELCRAIVALRGIRIKEYPKLTREAVWYDSFGKEYHLIDMMMRSINKRMILGYDNGVARVYLLNEDRKSARLFVYHDYIEQRDYLVLAKSSLYEIEEIDGGMEDLRRKILEDSGVMVAYRENSDSFGVLAPKIDDAFEEWRSGYLPLPGMCC